MSDTTKEFFDLLTEPCDCGDGKEYVKGYGDVVTRTGVCWKCRGTLRKPSAVGAELLNFVQTYSIRGLFR